MNESENEGKDEEEAIQLTPESLKGEIEKMEKELAEFTGNDDDDDDKSDAVSLFIYYLIDYFPKPKNS